MAYFIQLFALVLIQRDYISELSSYEKVHEMADSAVNTRSKRVDKVCLSVSFSYSHLLYG
jgi:hypothetical protein